MSQDFGAIDWLVLGSYLALLAATGVFFSRREQRNTVDYFLGGRRMPAWAVAISVLATSLSAATFVGGPQQAYVGDLTYLMTNLGMVLAAVVIAIWFIPVLYRTNAQTVYELLDTRFGPNARMAASGMFMVGRVFASGARLFIAAIPATLIIFGDRVDGDIPVWQIFIAIGLMTLVGILYTLVGGLSSVIWSDVIQTGIFLAAVVGAIGLLLWKIPLGPSEMIDLLSRAPGIGASGAVSGKLTFLNLTTDPTVPYSIWAVLIGFTLLGIGAYGTDQDLMQRMLACKDARTGARSVLISQLVGIPVVFLFLLVGLLLFIFYQHPEIMGDAGPGYSPDDSRKVFLSFILREMPAGMKGLMMAGLFAAGLSSLNSALNAMSSTFVADFYRRWVPDKEERYYVRVGRMAVVGWGLALCGFAVVSIFLQRSSGVTLIDFALGVMVFAYSGLIGVYFTALFTRRGSTRSVIAALVVGFLVVLLMQPYFWQLGSWLFSGGSEGTAGYVQSGVVAWLVALAFPWKMTIAATLSFLVCLSGRRR